MLLEKVIRPCNVEEVGQMLTIINAAAEVYRGVIPPDRWHDPYMPKAELESEIAAGVIFWGVEMNGKLVGVMGIQPVKDVTLIRHAYVLPEYQGYGIGGALINHLKQQTRRTMLVGTWAAASWAIKFYERHDFHLVSPNQKTILLKTYWTIAKRQIETSVVLTNQPIE